MTQNVDGRRAVVCVWNDIDPEISDEYDAWYQRDHLPDRYNLAGFRSSRRYIRVSGEGRQYLAFSELDSIDVGTSPAYLAKLANAGEWTRRIMPHFRRAIRFVANVRIDTGRGTGGFLGAALYNLGRDQSDSMLKAIEPSLAEVMADPCVVRTRVFQKSEAASDRKNPEATLRPDQQQTADFSIIVEGLHEATIARHLDVLHALPEVSVLAPVMTPSIYRLLYSSQH